MGLLPTHSSDWLAFIEPPMVRFFAMLLNSVSCFSTCFVLYVFQVYLSCVMNTLEILLTPFLSSAENGDYGWRDGVVKRTDARAH